jgi:type II secretory pathway predicted ATPase ExeA
MSQLLSHYGFRHHPFGRQTSNDALLRHRGFEEALGRLRFCVELDSIAILIAESGCGKSLLLGQLADELQRDGVVVRYFAHSSTGPFGLISVLARKNGISPKRSRAETASLLVEKLVDDERRHLLVIDEAHALPDDSLEDIRLLTITDFDRTSPFVLLLSGQPTLHARLAAPTHHALDQRIATVARLLPLSDTESREYIKTRLNAAGANKKQPVIDDSAIDAIFEASGGVPRRINGIATSALIVAAARKRRIVSAQDVQDALLDRGRP